VFHGVPALRLAQRLGVPLVVTVHTGPFSKLLQQRTMRYLTRRTLERADCVCPVSDDLRVQIEQAGIVPRRVEVTYNPVDTALFHPSTNLRTTHRRIAFAGRLEEYKGGLRVACAFAEVADRLPGWTLSIAGDGPERDAIQAFVAGRLDLAGRVGLLGRYTKPELADMLRASDLFACPSRHETFGLVIAEAMAAGLPVIAPDRTAPPEFVDKRSGVLVSPDDIEAIAAAMERIATSLSTYDRAAIRGRIVDRFGIEAFGERLLGIYRSLLPARLPEGEAACVD
jgi:glycosyltransferase involved in cell wall biosynthesis